MTLAPGPAASIFVVPLFGAGPGLNVDLATFSFQVPAWGSAVCACAETASTAVNTPTAAAEIYARLRVLFTASSAKVAGRWIYPSRHTPFMRAISGGGG